MSIPDGVTKFTFSGSLMSGVERWACSLYLDGYAQPPGSGSFDVSLLDTTTSWTDFRNAFLAQMIANDALTSYDAYWYQGGVAVAHAQQVVSHPGTGGTMHGPLQTAMVMTLRTATATRSGRGRIYLPCDAAAISGTTALFTSTVVNDIVDKLAAFLTSTNTGTTSPVVVSQTQTQSRLIVSVDADYVPDTQRRRRNKLTSARHTHAV